LAIREDVVSKSSAILRASAVIIAVVTLNSPVGAADLCEAPLVAEKKIDSAEKWWEAEDDYRIWKTERDGATVYRITGDIVHLTKTNFSSLARQPGDSATGVDEIYVDARYIDVSMPIRLDDARLVLHGETVRFGFESGVSITSPPAAREQGIWIVTKTLDLTDAPLPYFNRNAGLEAGLV
jgi:hypothetical protein